jgi:hypothetical protein
MLSKILKMCFHTLNTLPMMTMIGLSDKKCYIKIVLMHSTNKGLLGLSLTMEYALQTRQFCLNRQSI